jgi:nitroreductase
MPNPPISDTGPYSAVRNASARAAVRVSARDGSCCGFRATSEFAATGNSGQFRAAHIHEAPVWIVPCLEGGTATRASGSSIYPAVQNMLLAARALGLGATLTTLYLQFEKEAEAALGLPPNVHSYALLPVGYPMGRFGPVRRIPLADVVYEDRWGRPYRDQGSAA